MKGPSGRPAGEPTKPVLPIDIHFNKLLDWLIDRRHCNVNWATDAGDRILRYAWSISGHCQPSVLFSVLFRVACYATLYSALLFRSAPFVSAIPNVFKLSGLTTPAIPVTVPAHLHPTLYSALLTLTLVNISAFHSLWSPSSSQWSSEVKSTRLFRFLSTTFQPTTLSPLFSPFLISTSFTFGTSSMFYLSRLVVDWSFF